MRVGVDFALRTARAPVRTSCVCERESGLVRGRRTPCAIVNRMGGSGPGRGLERRVGGGSPPLTSSTLKPPPLLSLPLGQVDGPPALAHVAGVQGTLPSHVRCLRSSPLPLEFF